MTVAFHDNLHTVIYSWPTYENISDEESSLHGFLVILKRLFEEMFSSYYMNGDLYHTPVCYPAASGLLLIANLQSHYSK